jgi:HAD superfamily hydrolase (TIGR01509 family)
MAREIQAIIFDLDGTLADTFPIIISAWNAAVCEPLGREFTPEEVISRFGVPDAAMLQRDLPQAAWERALEIYYRHYEEEHGMVTPFGGVTEMLQTLQQRGVPLGVMTGKGRRTAAITMEKLGWEELFGCVVNGEDIEGQKPLPDGPLLAAQQLGVAPEKCAFVGDSPADIEAGKAAGMLDIVAGWHTVYTEQLKALDPACWADNPADIAAFCFEGELSHGR